MDSAIRARWRNEVVTTEEWKPHSDAARPVRGGEAGGFLVRSVQTGLIGYLKPLRERPGHSRSVYEKIASDLAFEIDVNVPPVVLYRRPDAQPSEPKEVSISFAWGGAMPWGDLFNIGVADGSPRSWNCWQTPTRTCALLRLIALDSLPTVIRQPSCRRLRTRPDGCYRTLTAGAATASRP